MYWQRSTTAVTLNRVILPAVSSDLHLSSGDEYGGPRLLFFAQPTAQTDELSVACKKELLDGPSHQAALHKRMDRQLLPFH